MARRRIGQEKVGFAVDRGQPSSLDALAKPIDWVPISPWCDFLLCEGRTCLATNGLVQGDAAVDLVRLIRRQLAEALDDRGSFRRFCGFSGSEPTPERTAFVRFRKVLVAQGLDKTLFDAITAAQGQSDPGEDRHACRCDDHRLGQ